MENAKPEEMADTTLLEALTGRGEALIVLVQAVIGALSKPTFVAQRVSAFIENEKGWKASRFSFRIQRIKSLDVCKSSSSRVTSSRCPAMIA